MSSSYVNDLRLEEIASGEQSGTWGNTTNTNLELIAEAFGYGTEAISTNANTHTSTIADGATDPVRAMYVKYTGALDSDCTITLAPNTVNKLWYVENATTDSGSSGPYNIILSQGTGANVTIPNSHVKAVYADGAGAGAAIVEAFTDLNVAGDLTVGDDLVLNSDSSVISMGAGADATFTHDGTTGLTIAANPFEVDSGGNITLDSHTGIFIFQDANSEILRFTEGNSGDVTIKLETNAKDLIFADNGDAINMKILDAAAGINVPGEVQTTKIAYTDGDDAITIADGGGITLSAGLDCGENNITNVGSIALDSISCDDTTKAIVFSHGVAPATVTAAASGNYTPDMSAYTNFILTVSNSNNCTLQDPTDEAIGQSGVFVFIQDGTGGGTLSHADDRYFVAGGTSITLSTAANAIDIVPYFVQADGKIHLGAAQKAFAEA